MRAPVEYPGKDPVKCLVVRYIEMAHFVTELPGRDIEERSDVEASALHCRLNGRILNPGEPCCSRRDFLQVFEALCRHLYTGIGSNAGGISSRPCEGVDETLFDRPGNVDEDDRNCLRCTRRGNRGLSGEGPEDIYSFANQCLGQRWKTSCIVVGEGKFDD